MNERHGRLTLKDFREVILNNFRLYPLMDARDVYKLVYQSAMGPGHAVPDPEIVRKWMDYEVNNLEEYDDENMTEELFFESKLIRVNLRPFLKGGGDAGKLCEIFIETANTFEPEIQNIRKLWKYAEDLSSEGLIGITVSDLASFILEMEKKSFPAAHHSTAYRGKYKPAYRVVFRKLFDEM